VPSRSGKPFVGWQPPTDDDHALGFVDFAIYPHLDNPTLPSNTMANAEKWAATLDCPSYAIDDDTAGGDSRASAGREER